MKRHCFCLRVRPGALQEYRRAHEAVWPDMLRALRDTGWTNYSLFLAPDGLLVGYVEAEDMDAARAAMARHPVNARWQEAMAGLIDVPQGSRPDQELELLDEVFNLEDQLSGLPG